MAEASAREASAPGCVGRLHLQRYAHGEVFIEVKNTFISFVDRESNGALAEIPRSQSCDAILRTQAAFQQACGTCDAAEARKGGAMQATPAMASFDVSGGSREGASPEVVAAQPRSLPTLPGFSPSNVLLGRERACGNQSPAETDKACCSGAGYSRPLPSCRAESQQSQQVLPGAAAQLSSPIAKQTRRELLSLELSLQHSMVQESSTTNPSSPTSPSCSVGLQTTRSQQRRTTYPTITRAAAFETRAVVPGGAGVLSTAPRFRGDAEDSENAYAERVFPDGERGKRHEVPLCHRSLNLLSGTRANSSFTTIMMQDLSQQYTQETLVADLIASGFGPGRIDFVYLPFNFRKRACQGYAFVNFVEPMLVGVFIGCFNGRPFGRYATDVRIIMADSQGRVANIERLHKSCLKISNPRYMPLVLKGDDLVPFVVKRTGT